MKVLVDMNVSPQCASALRSLGHEAVHWADVGAPQATDRELMAWAAAAGAVVLTHDLDFGDLLGASGALGPSVIQLRVERMRASEIAQLVAIVLRDRAPELLAGALVTLDTQRRRVRLLPIHRAGSASAAGAEES